MNLLNMIKRPLGKKIVLILCAVFIVSGTAVFLYASTSIDNLEISFFDIGQGDAALIQTPFGQNILIDGGPDYSIITRLSEKLPWWDKTIDLMILTHPHDDHVGGLLSVLERYKVKKILHTGVLHDSFLYDEWKQLIRDKKILATLVERPQTIVLGDGGRIEIIYPDTSVMAESKNNLNNSSIVLRLVYGENSFLFTGDAELEVEEYLLKKALNIESGVLKVGHHGSDTSSSEKFLQVVKPEIAVISVGEDNDFGHPSRRIIKRLERMGIDIYRTDEDATVNIVSDGEKYTIVR